jgi:hypothetical protein
MNRYNLLSTMEDAISSMGPRVFADRFAGFYLLGEIPDANEDDFVTGLISIGKLAEIKRRVKSDTPPLDPNGDELVIESELLEVGRFVVEMKKHANNAWANWISIGRATNNDLGIKHPTVSKLHARVHVEQIAVGSEVVIRHWLTDTDSTIGTVVNKKRLRESTPHLIESGDSISFGNVECVFADAPRLFEELKKLPGTTQYP